MTGYCCESIRWGTSLRLLRHSVSQELYSMLENASSVVSMGPSSLLEELTTGERGSHVGCPAERQTPNAVL